MTDEQKVKARQHMGYPIFGDGSPQASGYRFLTHYGTMEYKFNHMSPSEEAIVVTHITECDALEAAIFTSGSNLDTNKAAVWERNPNEIRDRQQLYRLRRLDLCAFMGVPPGPGLRTPGEIIV